MKVLTERGHKCVGLDLRQGRTTDVVASILDRRVIDSLFREHQFDGVVHAGALHRPDIGRVPDSQFALVNVEGTRILLDSAAEHGVGRFVYTSTTAVMTDEDLAAGNVRQARWFTEAEDDLAPTDVYGRSKLAGEALCRERHAATGLNLVILRPGRFFHRDLLPRSDEFSQANQRANEFLNRRASVDDVAKAHALAIERADEIAMHVFLISAPTPFQEGDCEELFADAPAVVARYFPDYRRVYEQRRWRMYSSIDRVYSSERAERVLGMKFSQTFADQL